MPTARLALWVSTDAEKRLRMLAAIQGRPPGRVLDEVLTAHLPTRAQLAEMTKGSEEGEAKHDNHDDPAGLAGPADVQR